MPWLRSGDNAATHPIVMRVVSLVRAVKAVLVPEHEVAVNEVFGFVTRCALQSAGHTTDYVIDEGTAWMMGGPRTERLLDLACKAGYLTRKKVKGFVVYMLVDDPQFLHMRLKDEIERERQRKADNSNTAITVPVRLRDGDECRYCSRVVNWADRKSGRGATYDHREGVGKPATVDTLVVACNACNAGRGDDPEADVRYPLRNEPSDPFYSARTAAFLLSAGHVVATTDARPGSQPGNAPSDPVADGTTPTPPKRQAPVTTPHSGNLGGPAPPGSADIEHPVSGLVGTGRDGSGSARSSSPAPRRKRSSRGQQRNLDRRQQPHD